MSKKILIRGARQLLTLRGSSAARRGKSLSDLAMIPDGAILVKDGRIETIGPGRRLENLAESKDALVIEADGCVVMPGFVDPHTHLVSGPPRVNEFEMRILGASLEQSGALHDGLHAQVRNVRSLPARRLELQARNMLLQFVRHGTTTLEAKTGYGLDGYLRFLSEEMLHRIAKRKTVSYVDADPAACGFTLNQTMQFLRAARLAGLSPRLHAGLHQADSNVELAVALRAESVSHCNYITDHQIGHLCDSSTVAIFLPGLAYHLCLDRLPPARRMIESGVAVALASGYDPLLSPSCNMQMVVSLACKHLNMSAAEAIHAATFNAAAAAGCSRESGSLEAGKSADILILAIPDYREIPYHFGMNLVSTVIRRGEIVHQETAPEWRVA